MMRRTVSSRAGQQADRLQGIRVNYIPLKERGLDKKLIEVLSDYRAKHTGKQVREGKFVTDNH